MDNTEKARELINKHLSLHGGDELGINDGDVYRAVLDAVSEALTIPFVVGQSEQLVCGCGKNKPVRREPAYLHCDWCGSITVETK